MIEYRKGSLFQAKPGTCLVHACNAKGVWGSGVAVQFRQKFPRTFAGYQNACRQQSMLGSIVLGNEGGFEVGCLVTSNGYGANVDSVASILDHTEIAIALLLESVDPSVEIHSPLINAGLFRVPWEKTEKIIEEQITKTGHKWVVWKL